MEPVQEKKEKLHQLVDNLPPDRLDAAEVLREQLQRETRVAVKDGKLIVRLGGLWKGVGITEEDIAEARQEMWGRMGQDEP
jgi:hypothetical protein